MDKDKWRASQLRIVPQSSAWKFNLVDLSGSELKTLSDTPLACTWLQEEVTLNKTFQSVLWQAKLPCCLYSKFDILHGNDIQSSRENQKQIVCFPSRGRCGQFMLHESGILSTRDVIVTWCLLGHPRETTKYYSTGKCITITCNIKLWEDIPVCNTAPSGTKHTLAIVTVYQDTHA